MPISGGHWVMMSSSWKRQQANAYLEVSDIRVHCVSQLAAASTRSAMCAGLSELRLMAEPEFLPIAGSFHCKGVVEPGSVERERGRYGPDGLSLPQTVETRRCIPPWHARACRFTSSSSRPRLCPRRNGWRRFRKAGAFTDKRPYLFTARTDGLGHLISGYPTTLFVRSERAQCREAERRLRQNFAALPDPEISHLWRGLAWVNTSLLPEVYDLGDEAIAIQACNGRGIATNTALGAEVAEMLATGDREVLSVKPSRPEPIRFYAIAALLPKLLMSLAYISD